MNQERAKELREKANKILKQRKEQQSEMIPQDLEELIEELSTHQIELELQNQELAEQQEELKAAKNKYFNLYNLAPVAYLSLNGTMQILEANKHAYELFQSYKGHISGRTFTEFIHPDWQDTFYFYIRGLKKNKAQDSVEIKLNERFSAQETYLYLEGKPLHEEGEEEKYLISLTDITSRKIAEQKVKKRNKEIDEQNKEIKKQYSQLSQVTSQLKQSEQNLTTILEAIPSPVIYKNAHGVFIGGNSASYTFFGLDSKSLKGKTAYDLYDKQKADFILRKDEEIRENEEKQTYELRHKNTEGQWREVVVHKNIYHIGNEKGIVALLIDVTDERQAKNELIQNENKFRTLFEQAGDIILILDKLGNIINYNLLFSKIMGYNSREIDAFRIQDICQQKTIEDMDKLEEVLKEQGSVTYEGKLLKKNGEPMPVEISLGQIEINREIDYLAIARDISERKKAEKALEKSESKFRNFFEQAHEGIALIDKTGRVVEWNKASTNLTGISEKEARQKYVWDINMLIWPGADKEYPENIKKKTYEILQGEQNQLLNRKINTQIINRQTGEEKHVSLAIFAIEYEEDYYVGAIFYDETARLNAEKKLAQNERFFRNISESMSDMVSILNRNGEFVWVSPSHEKIMGYTKQELIGLSSFSLIHPDDVNKVVDAFNQNQTSILGVHYRAKDKNGQYHWLEGTGHVLDDREAEEEYAILNTRDITQRKNATFSLMRNEELLNKVIENATVGIRLIDTNKNIIKVNKLYAQWHGRQVDEIINEKCYNFLHCDEKKNDHCDELFRIIEENDYLEQKIYREINGESKYFIFNAVSFRNEADEINGILEVYKDISDLEIAKRKADNLLKRLNMAIEVGNLGWWEWNINTGNVEFADKKITMLDYEKGEIKPDINGFIELIHPDDKNEAMESMRSHLRGESNAYTIEYRLRTKHGSYRWFYDQGQIVSWNKDGSPARMIGVIYNISQTVKQREQLKAAKIKAEEANRTKSEFLANMSHEIRTPLNSVLGFAEILKSELGSNSNYSHYLDGINSSAKNLLNLINDILDVSKIEAGKLRINKSHVEIKSLLNEVHQVFSLKTQEKQLDFTFEVDQALPNAIYTDAVRLRQIMFNLIGNAVKFTNKGSIKVSAWPDKLDDTNNLVDLVIKVADTGEGIPFDQQKIIFKPFRQQENSMQIQKGGTGLGLTITKRLVEMLNGEIRLKSEPNKGSEFSFILYNQPIMQQQEPSPSSEPIKHVLFKNQTILIVEDDTTNREVVKGLLKDKNLRFEEAVNGQIGIEIAEKTHPDLILMDVLMPEMDGVEASRRLKKHPRLKNLPVIALTAAAVKEKLDEIIKLADGVLYKPVSSIELINKLSEWLDHSLIDKPQEKQVPEYDFGREFVSLMQDNNLWEQGLKKELLQEVIPYFDVANRSYSLSKIEAFAHALEQTGNKWNVQILQHYTNELLQHTKQFKFEKIMKLMKDFAQISDNLKN